MSGHRIEWEIGTNHVSAQIVCDEPAGADCRLSCVEDCPEWGPLIHLTDGTVVHEWLSPEYHDGDPKHVMEPVAYCNVVEFLMAEGTPEDLYAGETQPLVSGPIDVRWEGPTCCYVWTYAEADS